MFNRKSLTLVLPFFISALIGVGAQQQKVKNAIPYVARPLPLAAVRVTGGPLKRAQDLNAEYLLKLEPDRMMAFYRKRAGLKPKAEGYGGWDGDGRNLTGHIAGHYLSAVSMMYAATGDGRFKDRVDYIVKEMKEVQDKNGDGFLGALEGAREKFAEVAAGNIRSTFFDLNGLWSPWYTLHKTYAGLRDAYRYTGNRTALELEIKYAAWAESILLKMNPDQIQQMLNTEFGGMNEVLADLYADTGDRRWLNLSHRFDHKAVVDPLSRREDRLAGLHGNTQVPKLLGVLMRYIYAGDKADGVAAEFFWDAVVNDHSYATGGHGKDEYFGPPDELSERIDGRTNESCNVYNMLKMTRQLFAIKPEIKYAEFEERALFNHVLASIDPEDGRTCYMVPIGQGVRHEYQDMFRSFTCCVGSGMESHSLHGDGIYYESQDQFWVNLYVPSTAEWKSGGVQFSMATDFPEGEKATLKLAMERARQFTLALRRPSWAETGFEIRINGEAFKDVSAPGTYVLLKRRWKTGDVVSIDLPKTLRIEGLADNKNRAAFMWGPLVLAGDLGAERRGGPSDPLPSFLTESRPIEEWLKPIPEKAGNFRSDGIGRLTDQSEKEVEFVPFYRLHRRTYSIYWDLYNSETWSKRLAEVATDAAKRKKLDSITTVFVQPGDAQKEKEFNQQGEDTSTDGTLGRRARRSKKWFSYDLPVDSAHAPSLLITYFTVERGTRTFDVLVNGQHVGQQRIERSVPGSAAGHFFDVEYRIPSELLKDKKQITVRFQATGGNEIAGVYGIRVIKASADK
ncbi:MAG TPA: beta-L-arabinofuranosidase domain-containing protein [Pyrinomonadaceae bacterium]|nr:beta-L-arabinofuranosidase domain-containing protein [Pyrinomonadaceae bacterium]